MPVVSNEVSKISFLLLSHNGYFDDSQRSLFKRESIYRPPEIESKYREYYREHYRTELDKNSTKRVKA